MRVILLAVIGCLLWVSEASAQKFIIKGQVSDSSKMALPSSTVMLLNQKDSTLVSFAASDAKGFFEMKNVSAGDFFLKVTFVGYATYQKHLSVKGPNSEINVGLIRMMPQDRQLDELVIKGEKAPVTVKRDTIEFNAGSFKVKANANVEDLLKKLPGVEVETDGTVRAQGEQVQRVMVDGREFFGRDPKLATRNLPADAVEKVQVFDKKSDQSVFTGIEDGQKEKTINLELKEEKRNGAFGTMMAGAGSNERYQAKANINRFGKGKQLSFLGMGNNINEQGFSFADFMNFTGGSQQLLGGGGGSTRLQIDGNNTGGVPLNFGGRQNGIMTNYAGGINFNKDLSKNTQLTSSYFYNRLDQDIRQITNRLNYLPNGTTYLFEQNSSQANTNDNHRVNLNIDHKIDSANSLKFSNSLTYSESGSRSITKSKTFDPSNVLQNTSDRNNINSQIATNLNSSLLLRHRFAKKGRSLSANLTLGISQTDAKSILNSSNQFFGANPFAQEVDQRSVQSNANQSYGGTLTYIEPLGGRKYLEASYSYRINKNQADRKMYNEKGAAGTLIDSLTNNYNSNYVYNRPGFNFRINRTKFNLAVGASYQNTRLEGTLYSMKTKQFTNIDRTFENFLPVLRFNYDFSNFKHLRLDYETSMQEPSIQQLQPIIDYTDPVNLSSGNPQLRPGYVHSISANFTTFDPAKFINFFGFVTGVYTTNAISTSQTINPTNFVRTTMPVNVSDNLALNANFSFGFPIKKLNSRFNMGPTGNYSNGINLLNDKENRTRQTTLGGSIRYNYTFKEILIVDLSANLSKQQTQYEFNQKQNQSYFNKTYTAEVNLTFLKNYQFNTSYSYYTYTSETTNFSQEIPILNLGLSRFLLKNNVGELKVGINNVLDQSLSVNQTATANYLQQTTYNNLGRYFMVSFTYALNKQLNPMGGGRRGRPGGMQMIINN